MSSKNNFLEKLRNELKDLPLQEVEDIIRDQEEYIHEAVSSGRSESEVIAGMGDPIKFAQNIKAEIKFEKIESKLKDATEEIKFVRRLRSIAAAAFALLLLAPFNLIFVFGPFMGLVGLLIGGWAASISVSAVGIGLALAVVVTFLGGVASIFAPLTILFGALVLFFAGLTVIALMYYVTGFVLKAIVHYLRWNLNFIRKQV